jgi:hypothetical protein
LEACSFNSMSTTGSTTTLLDNSSRLFSCKSHQRTLLLDHTSEAVHTPKEQIPSQVLLEQLNRFQSIMTPTGWLLEFKHQLATNQRHTLVLESYRAMYRHSAKTVSTRVQVVLLSVQPILLTRIRTSTRLITSMCTLLKQTMKVMNLTVTFITLQFAWTQQVPVSSALSTITRRTWWLRLMKTTGTSE